MLSLIIMKKTEEKVLNYIKEKNMIKPKDTVVVGLSGGADSVCLLTILSGLRSQLEISIKAIHVNHGIRKEAACEDEEFSRKLCEKLGIDFESYKKDIPSISRENHETEEECGRRIRYELFYEEAGRYDSSKIAVAHHMNDQAETILFRMARGTGIKGIGGMKPVNGIIIRPLLCLGRDEIESYLKECGQDYQTDATNDNVEYSRNLIRKQIIPGLESVNEETVSHICSLSEEVLNVMDYMDGIVNDILDLAQVREPIDKSESGFADRKLSDTDCKEEKPKIKSQNPSKYNASIIDSQDEVIKSYVIRKIIERENVPLKDIHREHIEAIIKILKNSRSTKLNLPRNTYVLIENGILSLGRKDIYENSVNDFCEKIAEGGSVDLPDGSRIKSRIIDDFNMSDIPQNTYTKWFDYDKIIDGLCIRYRQENDFFVINSDGNTKKLSDYMINEKIPKSERDFIPLIACKNHVVWIVGHRISADVKVSENTRKVIEISYERNK